MSDRKSWQSGYHCQHIRCAKRHRLSSSDEDDEVIKKPRMCGIDTDDSVTLTILFGVRQWYPPRAKRQIRCKLSEYPVDIIQRIHRIYALAIPVSGLVLKCFPNWNDGGVKKWDGAFRLREKTLGESGISDQDNLEVFPLGPPRNRWIPLPVSGEDVCAWMKDKSKKSFFHLVARLEICGAAEALEIFKLIRSRNSPEYFE